MFARHLRVFIATLSAMLIGGLFVGAVPASSGTAAPGVTDDEIHLAMLVADIDGLRARGLSLPAGLTQANTVKRLQSQIDSYGKVNGRRVVLDQVTWNPLDVTSFQTACTKATQDMDPFMVVNGTSYRVDALPCITVDGDTPMFFGEQASLDVIKQSGKNLVTLGVPSEITGKTTGQYTKKLGFAAKDAKIGILSANEPQVKSAADALEKELTKQGFDVAQVVEVNALSRDNDTINRESSAAVGTFQAAGVDTVFIAIGPSQTTGYIQELKRTGKVFKTIILDTGFASCSTFAAQRMAPEFSGAQCLTTWDTAATPNKDGARKDNALEAKCRAEWNASTGLNSVPGAPTGGLTAQGQTWDEDVSPNECTLAAILMPALKAAGKNPTWNKVYANIMKQTDGPAAGMSDGEGGFGKNKPYYATKLQVKTFNPVLSTTPKDPNGVTYGGCPVPMNCFVPTLVDGKQWFPIETAKG